MHFAALAPRRLVPRDRCGHCDRPAPRVWLVPGDVLDSCSACFFLATGQEPVHAQGHTTQESRQDTSEAPGPSAAAFYPRVKERRSA